MVCGCFRNVVNFIFEMKIHECVFLFIYHRIKIESIICITIQKCVSFYLFYHAWYLFISILILLFFFYVVFVGLFSFVLFEYRFVIQFRCRFFFVCGHCTLRQLIRFWWFIYNFGSVFYVSINGFGVVFFFDHIFPYSNSESCAFDIVHLIIEWLIIRAISNTCIGVNKNIKYINNKYEAFLRNWMNFIKEKKSIDHIQLLNAFYYYYCYLSVYWHRTLILCLFVNICTFIINNRSRSRQSTIFA